jgi:hypothetical protein
MTKLIEALFFSWTDCVHARRLERWAAKALAWTNSFSAMSPATEAT